MLKIRQIVIDAADIDLVEEFWAGLLGWPITSRSSDWIAISGDQIGLAIQRADDHRRPAWPNPEQPQQLHFDIPVSDIDRAERLVLGLGGAKLAERPDDVPPFRIYADPAGHPFCLEYPPTAHPS